MGLVNTGLIEGQTEIYWVATIQVFWRTNHAMPVWCPFLRWVDRLHGERRKIQHVSSLVFKKTTGSFLDDLILPTYYSSIATFSHKIPSMWELIYFTELYLEADHKQKHKTDWKVAISSNCQICVWALCHWFQPCVEPGRDSLDSAGWGDV